MKIFCWKLNSVYYELEESLGLEQRNELTIIKHTGLSCFYEYVHHWWDERKIPIYAFANSFHKWMSTKHSLYVTHNSKVIRVTNNSCFCLSKAPFLLLLVPLNSFLSLPPCPNCVVYLWLTIIVPYSCWVGQITLPELPPTILAYPCNQWVPSGVSIEIQSWPIRISSGNDHWEFIYDHMFFLFF